MSEVVIDVLAQVVMLVIPNAVETEGRFWSISDYPSTAGGRFASLNVGWLELAYFPRCRFQAEVGSLDASNGLRWFLNAEIATFIDESEVPADFLPDEEWWIGEDIEGHSVVFGCRPAYYSVPVECIGMPLGAFGVGSLSIDELAGVRRLALHAMRTGSARVNERSYSSELTRLVYERIADPVFQREVFASLPSQ